MAEEPEKEQEQDKYTVSYFRSVCDEVLDTRVHIFDGAIVLSGWKGDKQVTVVQMKKAIDKFLNHKAS
jgi:hypothetical protein